MVFLVLSVVFLVVTILLMLSLVLISVWIVSMVLVVTIRVVIVRFRYVIGDYPKVARVVVFMLVIVTSISFFIIWVVTCSIKNKFIIFFSSNIMIEMSFASLCASYPA